MGDIKMTFSDGNALTAAELNDFDTDSLTINDSTNEDKITINKSGTGNGKAIDIVNNGTDPTIQCNNTSSGLFIEYKDNGVVAFEVNNDGSIDMNDHQITNIDYLGMELKSSAPSASEGRIYYNSNDNILYFYNGVNWVPVGGCPAFWTDSNYYTVYEADWSSGGAISTVRWDITLGGGDNSVTSSNTSYAGGSAYECYIKSQDDGTNGSVVMYSKNIPTNRHIHFKMSHQYLSNNSCTLLIDIGNATDGWTNLIDIEPTTDSETDQVTTVLIIAKGSNVYDVYYGGKLILDGITKTSGAQIRFTATATQLNQRVEFYIDDIVYSNWEVA